VYNEFDGDNERAMITDKQTGVMYIVRCRLRLSVLNVTPNLLHCSTTKLLTT